MPDFELDLTADDNDCSLEVSVVQPNKRVSLWPDKKN